MTETQKTYEQERDQEAKFISGMRSSDEYQNTFKVGADWSRQYHEKVIAEKDAKISELEDKLYHESRRTPEVEYKLGHEIERLRKALKVAMDALEDLAATDFTSEPTALWLTNWRNDAKLSAKTALNRIQSLMGEEKK